MPTTADGFVYPDINDPVQVPEDIEALADSVQTWVDTEPWAGGGATVFTRKTANESVTSSTVMQDDDHLVGMTLGVGTWLLDAGFIMPSGGEIGRAHV